MTILGIICPVQGKIMDSKTFIYLIKNAKLIAQKEVKTIDRHHHAIEIIIKTEPGSIIVAQNF